MIEYLDQGIVFIRLLSEESAVGVGCLTAGA